MNILVQHDCLEGEGWGEINTSFCKDEQPNSAELCKIRKFELTSI